MKLSDLISFREFEKGSDIAFDEGTLTLEERVEELEKKLTESIKIVNANSEFTHKFIKQTNASIKDLTEVIGNLIKKLSS